MAFFDDMAKAVEDYPLNDVEIEIIDVASPGNAININEVSTFRVRVTNRGPLTLNGVTLRIRGQSGALVADGTMPPTFLPQLVTLPLPTIDPHGGFQLSVGTLKFKAPGNAQSARMLVKATLEGWNPTLDRLLNGHSRPLEEPVGTFSAPVITS